MSETTLTPPALAGLATVPPAERIAALYLVRYRGGTRITYQRALRAWAQWCAAHDLDLLSVRREHVELWLRELEARDLSPATRALRLAAVAGYYETAVEEEALARNPAARVRRPKVGKDSQRLGVDRHEGPALLAAAEQAGPRDYALLCLLLLNGLRIGEALGLRPCDLRSERGHRIAQVRRKGGAREDIALPPRTAAAIDTLVDARGQLDLEAPLFVDAEGAPLDVFDAQRIVRRLARHAGIRKHLTPHSFRHGFITAALDAGVPLHKVQDAAGHADPRTTRRYDRASKALDDHAAYSVAAYFASE